MKTVTRYENKIVKKAEEMQSGDIYRCEFGDYGHWVDVVFESCCPYTKIVGAISTEIHYHDIGSTDSREMYDLKSIDKVIFNVVGKEE